MSITTAPTPLQIAGGKAPMTLVYGPDVAKMYHTPSDEYSDNWDWAGALQDLDMFRKFSLDLANRKDWPNWLPSSAFRAIRDASRMTAP